MFSPELRAKAEAIVERYPVKRSALLPLLHLVQYQDGCITDDGVAECAELLDLTKAEVAAVSTFYSMYKRHEMGTHLVSVCTNFACAVRGGKATYERLRDHLGVGHDQTTPDGTITLEHAECLGNCEGAPVVTVDYLNYEWVDPDQAVELVESVRAGNPPQPTRGMIPPGIREVSHRLSGIGPIDPDAPGQRLGLATAEHGAVPKPASGLGSAGVSVITLPGNVAAPAPAAVEGNGGGAGHEDEGSGPDGKAYTDAAEQQDVGALADAGLADDGSTDTNRGASADAEPVVEEEGA